MTTTLAPNLTSFDRPVADARPIIPRNQSNLWSRAEQMRDDLYRHFAEVCERAAINPLILSSPPSVFPAWVRFEAWKRTDDPATTARSLVLIVIDPKPFHRFQFELDVTYVVGKTERHVHHVVPFGGDEVAALVEHLVNDGPKPRLRRFREASWQLWRPKNKVEGLTRDWLALLLTAAVIGVVGGLGAQSPAIALISAVVGVVVFVFLRKRHWIVRNDGKPDTEPRALVGVDSWQTVLFNMGAEATTVRDRFVRAVESSLGDNCRMHPERIWYWGLDGKEEREQFVFVAGRGIVFCQIHTYGKDLYFGWDGHLNRGQWVEQVVLSGIDKSSGNPISLSHVVPGTQPTSEYDLRDLSCLMEWTHAQLVKLLKQLMAERQIDQEIDFKIQRAERQQVVASGSAEVKAEGAAGRVRAVFKRTA